jgi:hypothetical protein
MAMTEPLKLPLTRMGTITPTAHDVAEWQRLATDAYRIGLNASGHRFSVAAAKYPSGRQMPLDVYDSLQAEYREWLIGGFPGYPNETLHARGL